MLLPAVFPPPAARAAVELEPIVVTAGRSPLADPGRLVVITREDIARQPAKSVEDLLLGVAGVDVRRRGPGGVQADVGIRGATFEQTLILVDGVKVSDSQTGHHNLDLPVALADIERIEVQKGPASRIWGPNAFGGVVNIVTRRAAGRSLGLQAQVGEHGARAGAASVSADSGGFAGRLSASGSRSDGYRHNTDYEIGTLSFAGSVPLGPTSLGVLAGYTGKDFGANGFYAAAYPNQREDTQTSFVSLSGDLGGGRLLVTPKLFWRRHEDHYLLDGTRPSLYENRHQTDSGGLELQATLVTAAGVTVLGGELAGERIESTNLGDHERERGGLFVNHRLELGSRASLAAGAFAAYHSDWGWTAWPGADLSVALDGGTRLFVAADKASRVPTYTELYYTSPTNLGNPDLKPEEAWTYETGIEWRGGGHRAGFSVFRRVGTNLFDWVRAAPADPWQAQNRTEVRTDGLEAGWEWHAGGAAAGFLQRLRAGYTWLDSERGAAGLESKYVLDHLRHQAVLEAGHAVGFGFSQNWRLVWERRLGGEAHFAADTRISRPFSRGEVFLEATNLFNARYTEVGGVPQPGRWLNAGFKINFGPW
ncbi:MAG: TonB-dependent receptor plug domain-containing protein [Candidatus Geothermincolia bacterium]